VLALDLQRFDLVVIDRNEDAFVDLVAAALVRSVDRVARHLIDELLPQPVAGLLVDLAKGHALRRGRGRIDADRTRDQRKLQISLPVRTGSHHTNSNADEAQTHIIRSGGLMPH
jgi:hypothetical protein